MTVILEGAIIDVLREQAEADNQNWASIVSGLKALDQANLTRCKLGTILDENAERIDTEKLALELLNAAGH